MKESNVLFDCEGGTVILPLRPLNDRLDGGHLIVNPPREVWERSALTPPELMKWSFLVAVAGEAMLDTLPQLTDGCINYWEAGNWALNDRANPQGRKTPRAHRRVHLHLLGRSPDAAHVDWQWGESPQFPRFADVNDWSSEFSLITAEECASIQKRIETLWMRKYSAGAFP